MPASTCNEWPPPAGPSGSLGWWLAEPVVVRGQRVDDGVRRGNERSNADRLCRHRNDGNADRGCLLRAGHSADRLRPRRRRPRLCARKARCVPTAPSPRRATPRWCSPRFPDPTNSRRRCWNRRPASSPGLRSGAAHIDLTTNAPEDDCPRRRGLRSARRRADRCAGERPAAGDDRDGRRQRRRHSRAVGRCSRRLPPTSSMSGQAARAQPRSW